MKSVFSVAMIHALSKSFTLMLTLFLVWSVLAKDLKKIRKDSDSKFVVYKTDKDCRLPSTPLRDKLRKQVGCGPGNAARAGTERRRPRCSQQSSVGSSGSGGSMCLCHDMLADSMWVLAPSTGRGCIHSNLHGYHDLAHRHKTRWNETFFFFLWSCCIPVVQHMACRRPCQPTVLLLQAILGFGAGVLFLFPCSHRWFSFDLPHSHLVSNKLWCVCAFHSGWALDAMKKMMYCLFLRIPCSVFKR